VIIVPMINAKDSWACDPSVLFLFKELLISASRMSCHDELTIQISSYSFQKKVTPDNAFRYSIHQKDREIILQISIILFESTNAFVWLPNNGGHRVGTIDACAKVDVVIS